jgi:hypothetical protein
MFQLRRGNQPLKFGRTEKAVSLNWASLATSLVVTLLTWAGVELIPQLQEYGGTVALVAGFVAQIIPIIVAFLRNNKDIVYEDQKLDPPKKGK